MLDTAFLNLQTQIEAISSRKRASYSIESLIGCRADDVTDKPEVTSKKQKSDDDDVKRESVKDDVTRTSDVTSEDDKKRHLEDRIGKFCFLLSVFCQRMTRILVAQNGSTICNKVATGTRIYTFIIQKCVWTKDLQH